MDGWIASGRSYRYLHDCSWRDPFWDWAPSRKQAAGGVGEGGTTVFECFHLRAYPGGGWGYYAAIKFARQRLGLALDENDLWVAATALAFGATLVSRDQDFVGIEGLTVVAPR